MISINPATLETVGEVEETPVGSIDGIVQRAREAFPAWRDRGIDARAKVIREAQQLLLGRSREIAGLITMEMGRPVSESYVLELSGSIDLMGYYAKRAHRFLDDRRVPLHHVLFMRRRSAEYFEPLGVMGIISPWNWPLLIPLGGIVPALLAGNAVVFKHSELTPLLAVEMRNIFLQAGVPEDVFQIVQGGVDQGKALVGSPVEKVFFTGSTVVGKKIFQQASTSLKKCVLEMGGSDPAVVCDDADPEFTSSGLLWGGFSNCGQNCNSIERIFIQEGLFDSLIDLLMQKMDKMTLGDPRLPGTDMGPLATEGQLKKIEGIVEMARELGAEIIMGGNRTGHLEGHFFEPTLIRWPKSIPQPKDIEIFGPVLYVTPVDDDDEAVRLANRSDFGLAASVWTENSRRGHAIARRLESGTVMINDVIVSFGMTEASWTGIKKSGIGWVHGEKGLDEMVNIKYVNRDPMARSQKFWWFPYSTRMMEVMGAGMDFLFSNRWLKRIASVPKLLSGFGGYLLFNRRKKDKL